jgi:hypothetical protein
MPGGAVGCSNAHIAALKLGIETKRHFVVVEDDFKLKNPVQATKQLHLFFDLNVPWEMILLSANIIRYKFATDKIVRIIEAQTTGAYIVHCDYAKTLLDNFCTGAQKLSETSKHDVFCIDQHWKMLQPSGHWYSFSPCLAYQKQSFSDIEQRNVFYAPVLNFRVREPPTHTLILIAYSRTPEPKVNTGQVLLKYRIDSRLHKRHVFYAESQCIVAQSLSALSKCMVVLRFQFPDLKTEIWV